MTQLASICKALLDGEVLSIMTGFKDFGCTNLPREIGRSIERKFGVVVDKTPTPFRSKRNIQHYLASLYITNIFKVYAYTP